MKARRIATWMVFAVGVVLAAQSDPWAGVWKLNVEKSTYQLGSAPRSAVSRLEPAGDVWKMSQDAVDAQGNPSHTEVTARFDGKDYPVTGAAAGTTYALTRVDDHTYDLIAKRNGMVTATARTVVSSDGHFRTTTTTAPGQTLKNVAVYERQ